LLSVSLPISLRQLKSTASNSFSSLRKAPSGAFLFFLASGPNLNATIVRRNNRNVINHKIADCQEIFARISPHAFHLIVQPAEKLQVRNLIRATFGDGDDVINLQLKSRAASAALMSITALTLEFSPDQSSFGSGERES
jgi:hypothetical protein